MCIYRVYLGSAYFAETKNFLLSVGLDSASAFSFQSFPLSFFLFSFFFFHSRVSGRQNLMFTIVTTLFMGPTVTLFRKKILKMSPMALFTYLKIILLEYFQF